MNLTPKNTFAIFVSFLLVFTVALPAPGRAFAQTQPDALIVGPTFDVGDKWVYRLHDKGNLKDPVVFSEQVFKTNAESGRLYVDYPQNEHKGAIHVKRYDYKRLNERDRFAFDSQSSNLTGKRFSKTNSAGDFVQLPLEVGKKYSVTLNYTYSGAPVESRYDAEVLSFDKVRTEAGEFKAYKIVYVGSWNNLNAGTSGRLEAVRYFAPDAKRIVLAESKSWAFGRLFDSDTLELIKWEPKAVLPDFLKSAAE
jgi:hypothetical protein